MKRRTLLKGGAVAAAGGLVAKGLSAEEADSSESSGAEQELETTSTTDWSDIDQRLEGLEEKVDTRLGEYRENTKDLRDRYDAFYLDDKHTFADGFLAVDADENQFKKHKTENDELSVEEEFLNDFTVYEEIGSTRQKDTKIPDETPLVDHTQLTEIFTADLVRVRAAHGIGINEELAVKAKKIGKELWGSGDKRRAKKAFEKYTSEMEPVYQELKDLESKIKERGESEERLDRVSGLRQELKTGGTQLYSMAAGMELLGGQILALGLYVNTETAGKKGLETPRIKDGRYDFNGDGKVDETDVYTLSWLKEYSEFQHLFGEDFSTTGGNETTSEDVKAYHENPDVFRPDTEDTDTYRIFYEPGMEASIEGLRDAIKAADLLEGGNGEPEILVNEAPTDVPGNTARSTFTHFNNEIGITPNVDYNILLSSSSGKYRGGDYTGWSEIAEAGDIPSGYNAGVIFDEEHNLKKAEEEGIPLFTPHIPTGFTVIHEIRHAQGADHYDMETTQISDDPWTLDVTDVMYTPEGHERSHVKSEDSYGISHTPKMLSDFDPAW